VIKQYRTAKQYRTLMTCSAVSQTTACDIRIYTEAPGYSIYLASIMSSGKKNCIITFLRKYSVYVRWKRLIDEIIRTRQHTWL